MQGTLETFSVVEILQVLGNAKHSGTLHIECPDRQIDVHFVGGRIAETRDSTRAQTDTVLGSQLIKRSLISEPHLQEALADQESNPRPLGTLLVEKNFISEHDLREVLSRQIASTLVAAKTVGQGTFVFVADPMPQPVHYITIETYQVLVEISSVVSDYLLAFEVLGQTNPVLIRNRDYDTLPRHSAPMGRDEFYVLSLVDDRKAVRDITAASRLEEITTISLLGKFAEAGVLLAKAPSQARADDDDELLAHRDSIWAEVNHLLDDFGRDEQAGTAGSGAPAAPPPDSGDEIDWGSLTSE
jgi:hypothetical protein